MGEMDNLSLSGGRRRTSAPKRRGPVDALDRRQGLRNSIRRSKRNLTGVMRRIRGKGIPGAEDEEEEPEGESLMTAETNGASGFHDDDRRHEDRPKGEMDYSNSSKPVLEMDSDDNDDFLDPDNHSNDGGDDHADDHSKEDENHEPSSRDEEDQASEPSFHDEEDKAQEPSSHDEEDQVPAQGSDHSEVEEGDYNDKEKDDGQWGRYDDEYGTSVAGSDDSVNDEEESHDEIDGSYRNGDDSHDTGGYKDHDGENRQDHGSPRSIGGRRRGSLNLNLNLNRPSGLLKQISKKLRPRRRSRRSSTSNLDHTNLISPNITSRDPYSCPSSPARGRIEGFGSTPPNFASPRTLRQKLKDFREHRIAARKEHDEGLQKMDVGGGNDSKRKTLAERIDSVVDAMIEANATEPEMQGYMTAASPTVTPHKSVTATPPPTPADASKMSYLRKQFGDDNAYIVYLEGEKVAHELEVLSHKNRIKELEAEARRLKGLEGNVDDDGDSVASEEEEADKKESEIERQTGVPEEGVLIDLEGTTTVDQETNAKSTILPLQLPLMEEVEETEPPTSSTATSQSTEAVATPPLQNREIPNDTGGTNTMEQSEGVLVDLTVRQEAKDIVESILADLFKESKTTNLNDGDQNNKEDTLLTLKLEPPSNESKINCPESESNNVTAVIGQGDISSVPTDALPDPTSDTPSVPPADALPEPPSDGSPATLAPLDLTDPTASAPLQPPADISTHTADASPQPAADSPSKPVDSPPLPPANMTLETEINETVWI